MQYSYHRPPQVPMILIAFLTLLYLGVSRILIQEYNWQRCSFSPKQSTNVKGRLFGYSIYWAAPSLVAWLCQQRTIHSIRAFAPSLAPTGRDWPRLRRCAGENSTPHHRLRCRKSGFGADFMFVVCDDLRSCCRLHTNWLSIAIF